MPDESHILSGPAALEPPTPPRPAGEGEERLPRFLTLSEAASMLGFSRRWFAVLLRKHACACYRFGGLGADPRFLAADLAGWAEQFRVEGAGVPARPPRRRGSRAARAARPQGTTWGEVARSRLTGTEAGERR